MGLYQGFGVLERMMCVGLPWKSVHDGGMSA
jgi:hypothetical protein